ncbi:MAG TPA: methionine--tRNA ligase [archaeon]|nr:methionine--tRNA ligase [archaeon]
MKKFYITSAIAYPSGQGHLGHAYEFICTDVIARYHKLLDENVFFLTGTDEHGQKIAKKAAEQKLTPKKYVDKMSKKFQKLCKDLEIDFHRFIRTTDKDHEENAQKIFQKVLDKKEIYLSEYEGHYCSECEAFYTLKELSEGKCRIHGVECELIKEPSYFFKMSQYEAKLKNFFKENPDFIFPKSKMNEIENRLKEGLKDLSVSRVSINWGIPLLNDSKHVIYVWFDALLNYHSGVLNKKDFWPADIHVIGKDILWFHSVIWPSILMAAELDLPKKIVVHGFINAESGEKMSKSLGNVVDPQDLLKKYPADSLRYYLMREIPFGEDGSFSEKALIERNNSELADSLGNLVNRTMSMIEKYNKKKIPISETDKDLEEKLNAEKIKNYMDKFEFHLALKEIFEFIHSVNKYVNEKEPWKQEEKDRGKTMYNLADSIRVICILLKPFIPVSVKEILRQVNLPLGKYSEAKLGLLKESVRIRKKKILFEKLEFKEKELPQIKFTQDKKINLPNVLMEFNTLSVQKRSQKLERIKKEVYEKIDLSKLMESDLQKEYKSFIGKTDFGEKPSTSNLFELFEKEKKLPNFNTLADIYNLFSLKTGIVMGAYDREKIYGNVSLREAKGNEIFFPIGTKKLTKIFSKEVVLVDDKNNVITRWVSRQSEKVKTTFQTKHALVFLQGNSKIKKEELNKIAEEMASMIKEICGGSFKVIK